MKLAVSCIAWEPEEDARAAEVLAGLGCEGVELAPSRATRSSSRVFWESRGLPIVAMQALLFGHPELRLFDEATRPRMLAHLGEVIRLGGQLGCRALVFGSPKNRARGSVPPESAFAIATDFFGALGRIAEQAGTCLCIEPNPPQYGADFVTTAREALRLVEAVASPGFGLHLDTACARLAGEDFAERVRASAHVLRHCHASAPDLAPVTARPPGLEALTEVGYGGFVSIEQRQTGLEAVARAVEALREPHETISA